jgi:hypothetical protein
MRRERESGFSIHTDELDHRVKFVLERYSSSITTLSDEIVQTLVLDTPLQRLDAFWASKGKQTKRSKATVQSNYALLAAKERESQLTAIGDLVGTMAHVAKAVEDLMSTFEYKIRRDHVSAAARELQESPMQTVLAISRSGPMLNLFRSQWLQHADTWRHGKKKQTTESLTALHEYLLSFLESMSVWPSTFKSQLRMANRMCKKELKAAASRRDDIGRKETKKEWSRNYCQKNRAKALERANLSYAQEKLDPTKVARRKATQAKTRQNRKADPVKAAKKKEGDRLRRERDKLDSEKVAKQRVQQKVSKAKSKLDPIKVAKNKEYARAFRAKLKLDPVKDAKDKEDRRLCRERDKLDPAKVEKQRATSRKSYAKKTAAKRASKDQESNEEDSSLSELESEDEE